MKKKNHHAYLPDGSETVVNPVFPGNNVGLLWGII
jgi:hypothetical protein